ncbi:MAG: hypothetical protein JRF72_14240 [Deltaproteobacteria bacterium]|jgi:uncharacterized membrane protein HdeD (DUF308 family)|nr:hypothetical protein [Deltaproteobacteria bacterium]
MDRSQAIYHVVWGALLLLMGVLLIIQVPQVMERITRIEYHRFVLWFIRIIIYIIALLLIGGGARKIYENYKYLKG